MAFIEGVALNRNIPECGGDVLIKSGRPEIRIVLCDKIVKSSLRALLSLRPRALNSDGYIL